MKMCQTLVLLQTSDSDSDDGMELSDDEACILVDSWVQDLDRQHKRKMLIFSIHLLLQAGMPKGAAYQQAATAFHMSFNIVRKQ